MKKLPIDFSDAYCWNYSTKILMGLINANSAKYQWMIDTMLSPLVKDKYILTTEKLNSQIETNKSLYLYYDVEYYELKQINDLVTFIIKQVNKGRYVFLSCRNNLIYRESPNKRNIQTVIYGYDYNRSLLLANRDIDMRLLRDNSDNLLFGTEMSPEYCPLGRTEYLIALLPRKRNLTSDQITEYSDFSSCFKNEIRVTRDKSQEIGREYVGLYSILEHLAHELPTIEQQENIISQYTYLLYALRFYYTMLWDVLKAVYMQSGNAKRELSVIINESVCKLTICRNLLMKFSAAPNSKYITKVCLYLNEVVFLTNQLEKALK